MASAHIWDQDLETTPWDVLRRQQLQRIPDYVNRLKTQSVLYREKLRDTDRSSINSFEALAELPFTEKVDLRQGQADDGAQILGDQQAVNNDDVASVVSSSGTTGRPVFFGLTNSDVAMWRHGIAGAFFTAGVEPGRVAALSTGMPIVAGGVPYFEAIREAGATAVWFGGQTSSRMAQTVQQLKVDTLVVTASFATHFAGRVEEELGFKAQDLGVTRIVAGGEPGMGNPEIRARVMDLWGAERISEVMGLGDVMPAVWAECEEGHGMHFTAVRDVLPELIDPVSLTPVEWTEGATGELVYTTFTREATPVLRFRSRDHVRVEGTECACGRTTPRIRCFGRTDDMLIYKAMNVFPGAIRDVAMEAARGEVNDIMRIRKSTDGQVRFDQPIPLEVQLINRSQTTDHEDIARRIEEHVLSDLRVRVRVETYAPGTFDTGMYKNSLTYVQDSDQPNAR